MVARTHITKILIQSVFFSLARRVFGPDCSDANLLSLDFEKLFQSSNKISHQRLLLLGEKGFEVNRINKSLR